MGAWALSRGAWHRSDRPGAPSQTWLALPHPFSLSPQHSSHHSSLASSVGHVWACGYRRTRTYSPFPFFLPAHLPFVSSPSPMARSGTLPGWDRSKSLRSSPKPHSHRARFSPLSLTLPLTHLLQIAQLTCPTTRALSTQGSIPRWRRTRTHLLTIPDLH